MKDINNGNLSFQNVQIKIGDENVVNNINGEIIRGKINYLMGRNASGKTTLILSLIQFIQSKGFT